MPSKPLNFLNTTGQRNPWIVAVITALLLLVKILGQIPYTADLSGYFYFNRIPKIIDRVFNFAIFGEYENSFIEFPGQLTFFLVLLTWVLLIVGIIRYYGEKRSVTILKLVALFVLWQGLFDVIKVIWFAVVIPYENRVFESYFSIAMIVFEIILPVLLAVFLLAMLSPTPIQPTESSTEYTPLNRWQRGFHYFLDRWFIWFCGYNFYLMTGFSGGKITYPFVGIAVFLTQLAVLQAVSEWLFGVTLTKIITGCEVVRTDGKPITLIQATARSLIRIIPFGWLSVFGKTPWIDGWTGTEVRYVHKDEPLLRLHKCLQLGMGILFFFSVWFLVIVGLSMLHVGHYNYLMSNHFFPFFILLICFLLLPFLQAFWLAAVVSYYRDQRAGKPQRSNSTLVQAFYCWIPIQNFFYLGSYLDEITSHMEHLGISEEDNDRIGTKIRRFSNVFGLTSLFIAGLLAVIFISTSFENIHVLTGLIAVLTIAYAFFAWDLSRALKNTVVKHDSVSELIDDLG